MSPEGGGGNGEGKRLKNISATSLSSNVYKGKKIVSAKSLKMDMKSLVLHVNLYSI